MIISVSGVRLFLYQIPLCGSRTGLTSFVMSRIRCLHVLLLLRQEGVSDNFSLLLEQNIGALAGKLQWCHQWISVVVRMSTLQRVPWGWSFPSLQKKLLNFLPPKDIFILSAVPSSCLLLIPLMARTIFAKAETSIDRLIDDSTKFDGVSTAPPFSPALAQNIGNIIAYWQWVSPPEIQVVFSDDDGIGSFIYLRINRAGNCPITFLISL